LKDKCRWGKPRRYRHDSLLSCRNFRSGRSLPFQAVPNAPKISAVQEHCPPENHSPIAIRHSLSFHHSLFATRHSPPFLARQETRPPKTTRHSLLAIRYAYKVAKTFFASTGFSTFSSPTTFPSRKRTMRWQCLAMSGSWVTMTMVRPSACKSWNRAMISSPVLVSRLPVGSSPKMIKGSLAKARAIATLCCSPPDICVG